jgi:uncharacterized protein YcgI (DUF1989 family)
MAYLGHAAIEIPQPINLFMEVGVEPDGSLAWGPATSTAGDHVVFRALLDSIVVASACPQDLNEINNWHPSSVALELLPD